MPVYHAWLNEVFEAALAVSMAAAWFRRDKDAEEDDAEIVTAHGLVLDGLSDADLTAVMEGTYDRNWRNQVTVEQAEAIEADMRLRNQKNRN